MIRRVYDASAEDVWDAITDQQRLVRWFLQISDAWTRILESRR